MSAWTMPDWMRQFEDLFMDTGVLSVEATMNTYGAKAAHKIGLGDDEEARILRALLINCQVGLLTALRARGLLKDVPPCLLRQAATAGAKVAAAAVRLSDGTVWRGASHATIYSNILRSVLSPSVTGAFEGFVDADGAFLDRRTAYERAVACGQIKEDGGSRILTSLIFTEMANRESGP